ncbi:MAG: hypothetical protein K8I00_11235, partial [Candidatus Omnitrophica bacterium]|nr:hypothetical protein [Candidatus Omnitrophota bacterium]
MRAKGLTLFRKIFLAYVLIGVVIIAISNALQYSNRKHFIEENFRSQGRQVLHSAVDYFEEVYNHHLIRDLRLIVESPTLDTLLTSQKNEALIARPNVEKLFLQFTRYDADKYLSLRFIDAKGIEQVIAEGNRRVREYRQYEEIRDHSRERLYAEIYHLFEELRTDADAGVFVSKPFLYENQWSVLAGVPKPDPEVLGFGGAVIVHISLNGFYDY